MCVSVFVCGAKWAHINLSCIASLSSAHSYGTSEDYSPLISSSKHSLAFFRRLASVCYWSFTFSSSVARYEDSWWLHEGGVLEMCSDRKWNRCLSCGILTNLSDRKVFFWFIKMNVSSCFMSHGGTSYTSYITYWKHWLPIAASLLLPFRRLAAGLEPIDSNGIRE